MKQKTACLGLFSAVAIILGYVESLVPVFAGIPGIKLGLANLGVLFILKKYSFREAALVSVVRILVIGFMFGNLFSILYSVAGGVSHNIGQLIIAMLIVQNASVFVYAPALLVAGVAAGVVIGGLTNEILKRVHL